MISNIFHLPILFYVDNNKIYYNRFLKIYTDSYFTDYDTLYIILKNNRIEKYFDILKFYKIDFNTLLLCNEKYLKYIGIPVGPRIVLRRIINNYKFMI